MNALSGRNPGSPESDAPPEIAEPFLFGIVGLGMLNGLFSPFVPLAVILNPIWYPSALLPNSMPFILMFASLIVSTLTIMVAGVPAALYERFANKGRTGRISLWIWVSVLAFLSVPAVLRALSSL
jgi:hypothetical protein